MKSDSSNDEAESDTCSVQSLPDSLLLHIFNSLVARDVLSCTQVCARWRAVAYDESLWKSLVYRHWNIGGSISPGHCSWRSEYKRLYYHAPLIWSETLTGHIDEVLDVSFAHKGNLFATTSRDATVKVWQIGYPTKIKYSFSFREVYEWELTVVSFFNVDDTKLLVCCDGKEDTSFTAILSLQHNFQLLNIFSMNAFGLFGTWINRCTFLLAAIEDRERDESNDTVHILASEVNEDPKSMPSSPTPIGIHSGTALFSYAKAIHEMIYLLVSHVPQDKHSSAQESKSRRTSEDKTELRNLLFINNDCHLRLDRIRFKENSKSSVHGCVVESTQEMSLKCAVIGHHISHDHRYLFLNCRPWRNDADENDLSDQPELSSKTEVRVIDLQNLCDTGVRYKGHNGDTLNYFIELDSSDNYIGSGSQDAKAYLWDRHYQCSLGTLDHGPGVVNAVAFNPRDEECFVTVSDDHTIKIWRSRNRQNVLKTQAVIG